MVSIVEEEAQRGASEADEAEQNFRFSVEIGPNAPTDPQLVGGKGAGLVEMTKLGLPVPPGFILTTEAYRAFSQENGLPEPVWQETLRQVKLLEEKTGLRLGDSSAPLIVSARSGAPVSMPGRMITILNIGINDQTITALGGEIGEQAAWEAYFELASGLGTHVFNINPERFRSLRENALLVHRVNRLNEVPLSRLKQLVSKAKKTIADAQDQFPQDSYEQLRLAVAAVFDSWNSPRAIEHRKREDLPDSLGTAVTIQHVVFGNSLKGYSGSGVATTRNPRTYDKSPLVVFAEQAQGFAVVGDEGDHKPKALDTFPKAVEDQLGRACLVLEGFGYPQQIEFTVVDGKVWFLQTRDAHLSNLASWRRIYQLYSRGLLPEDEAMKLLRPNTLESLLVPSLDPLDIEEARRTERLLTTGAPLSIGGYATGRLVASLAEARRLQDEKVILLATMNVGDLDNLPSNVCALLLRNGCIASHFALEAGEVAKTMPVVFGITNQCIEPEEVVTVDGASGAVIRGRMIPSPKQGSALLKGEERAIIEKWLGRMLQNPWNLIIPLGDVTDRNITARREEAASTLEKAKGRGLLSHKAFETIMAQVLFPQEISTPYAIFKPGEEAGIRALLYEIIERDQDATVRTCHHPTMRGGGPYAVIRSGEDIERFFSDPEYPSHGGYHKLITETNPTELLVGEIPKGKMDHDLFDIHCACTLTVTRKGEIIFQVHPGSPLLRDIDAANPQDLITFTTRYDPERKVYKPLKIRPGENLQDDPRAMNWAAAMATTVFVEWWTKYLIPETMAAINYVFPPPHYATPVLEIQARIAPDGQIVWKKIYGIKADEVNPEERPPLASKPS